MRNKTYLAVFEPAEGGAYSVYFPHVLGCVSYGKDFIDAQKMAKEALELPLYFSFAGNLTYRNARNLHDTVLALPLDRIVVESESPFMPPSVYRGQRNMPANTIETVKFMAEMLSMDIEELADQLWKNSCKLFRLPE